MAYCNNCGTNSPDGTTYCTNCGATISSEMAFDGAPVEGPKKTASAVDLISMILGIISAIPCCTTGWCGNWVFAIPAIILAIVAKGKGGKFSGMAKAGLITGIVGVALPIIWNVIGFVIGLIQGLSGAMYY